MPSKKNGRKHSTRKIDDEKALQASLFAKVDPKTWDTLTAVLKQFKVDGTGIYCLVHDQCATEVEPCFSCIRSAPQKPSRVSRT